MYKRLLIAIVTIAASSVVSLTSVQASHGQNHGEGQAATPPAKVEICHSRQPQPSNGNGQGAQGNPYGPKRIEVSESAIVTEGHSNHDGSIFNNTGQDFWGDIIPPFPGYPGLNWTAAGIAIWSNDCQYPAPETPIKLADIKAVVTCDTLNKRATITLTNTGLVSGSATLRVGLELPKSIAVNVGTSVLEYVTVPNGGILIKIESANKILFEDKLYKCEGGQGGGTTPTTPTVPTTPTTPNTPATPGQGSVAATPATSTIASLPYTAGSSTQLSALIVSFIAILALTAGAIIKKAYLKQI